MVYFSRRTGNFFYRANFEIALILVLILGSASVSAFPAAPVKNIFQGGYAGVINPSTTSNTVIKGSWNVSPLACQPTLSQNQEVASYIGFFAVEKGTSNSLFLGIGVYEQCLQGQTTPVYSAITIVSTAGTGIIYTLSTIHVKPPDKVSAVITLNPSTDAVKGTIRDTTNSQSGSHSDTLTFTPTTYNAQWLISPTITSATTILPLADFTTPIKFANAALTDTTGTHFLSKLPGLTNFELVLGSDVLAIASPISGNGNSFHITWKAST
ncbi:MAG: G1 family endopeptidase [Thaumarchaeota archaeon]|nr:G1 family endopeptidase [Nitrososphaerota archaeon]